MKRNVLGSSGIEVSELCFGALPMGPLQKDLPVEESAGIIAFALENGVNFIDTAQLYGTYAPIKAAMEMTGIRPVIASKSAADTYEGMEKAINEALECMGIDYIDIFHLHAARAGADVFDTRAGALQCLVDYKGKGIIKAVGISAHNVKVTEAAAVRQEIDIVFPLLNKAGRGISGGTAEDMERAAALCANNGKGIYLMKVLGGGALIESYNECMEYARSLDYCQSIAVGMVSREEALYNIRYFNGEEVPGDISKIRNSKKVIVLQRMCISCGKCIETCHSEAAIFDTNGKSRIDPDKCVQCGYCVASCPAFCIRVV